MIPDMEGFGEVKRWTWENTGERHGGAVARITGELTSSGSYDSVVV